MQPDLLAHLAGAGFNLAVALLIVRLIYYPTTQDKQYVLTFVTFSTVTYFVLGLLTSVDLSIGVGFGLFAIFSVLRYRTDTISAREMTYLFVLIALAVMNSVLATQSDYARMLASNAVVVLVMFVLEREWGFHFEASKQIHYDKVELVVPSRKEELLADLRARTGLPVRHVAVGRIDMVRDTAELTLFFDDREQQAAARANGTKETS
ncbi:MAG: DUF4956 domain-containing protein [Acidobacteriia bacterium]|nr:DUF4956 domain-containing protein [Terriglobia bacterium]MYC68123.1 DUF4956 domain-containing protein [Terriglobia bacterium]